MNEVQIVEQNGIATTEDFKQVAIDYLKSMGLNLPEHYAKQFIELAKSYGLNPFKREIYAVPFGNKFNIITGYEVYLKRAERLGKLDGWNCEIGTEDNEKVARLTIYRKDWSHPFIHTAKMSECKQNSPLWQKMPSFMLRKVAIAQGFRMCFPDEFGGMPYTSDEMPEGEKIENLKSANVEKVTNPSEQLSSEAQKEREAEMQKKVDVSQNVLNLESLLAEYKDAFKVQPKAYQMALDCVSRGNDRECFEKYVSCKNYLLSKGIQVA